MKNVLKMQIWTPLVPTTVLGSLKWELWKSIFFLPFKIYLESIFINLESQKLNVFNCLLNIGILKSRILYWHKHFDLIIFDQNDISSRKISRNFWAERLTSRHFWNTVQSKSIMNKQSSKFEASSKIIYIEQNSKEHSDLAPFLCNWNTLIAFSLEMIAYKWTY